MTKKVFIGVLAALMLFAFVACEPQQVEWPYTGSDAKDVVNITLSNPSEVSLYAGEAFATSYAKIDIERLDGTVSPNVDAELTAIADVNPGKVRVNVSWGTDNRGYVVTDAIEVTSIVLKVEKTENLAAAPTEGTVTYVYSDGHEVEGDAPVALVAGEAENTVVYKLAKGDRSTAEVVSNPVSYTLAPEAEKPVWITPDQATGIELVWYVNGEKVEDNNGITVTVGDKVAYQVRGTAEGTSGCALTTDNYDVTGTITSLTGADTVATGYTTTKDNITDEDTKAYTIEIQFKGVEGSDNYGERWAISSTLTVADTLTQDNADDATWYFNPTAGEDGAYTASKDLAPGAYTFKTSDFKAQATTENGVRVELVADVLRGKVDFSADELTAGASKTIEFHWYAVGYPEVEGYDSVTVKVANPSAAG